MGKVKSGSSSGGGVAAMPTVGTESASASLKKRGKSASRPSTTDEPRSASTAPAALASHVSNSTSSSSSSTTTTTTTTASVSSLTDFSTTSFVETQCRIPIHLHPSKLGNVGEGVEEVLNSYLMRYLAECDGVVLAYDDVRVESPVGRIFYERPYINFHVSCRFLAFRAQPGQHLIGVVSKISPDHIGLLVHGAFNASIHAEDIPSHYQYHYDAQHQDMFVDTLYTSTEELSAAAAAAAGGVGAAGDAFATPNSGAALTKAELKRQKLLAKELRRKAWEAAQKAKADEEAAADGNSNSNLVPNDDDGDNGDDDGKSNMDNSEESSSSLSSSASSSSSTLTDTFGASLPYHIRIGSRIRFVVRSVQRTLAFFTISGSFTEPSTRLIPGEPVALPGAAVLDLSTTDANSNPFENGAAFAEMNQQQHQQHPHDEASSDRVSKKDMKAAKKAAKEAKRLDKIEKKRQRREEFEQQQQTKRPRQQ